jgi:hypothetical protein
MTQESGIFTFKDTRRELERSGRSQGFVLWGVVGQSVKDGVHLIGRVGCDTDTDKGSTVSNEWRHHHLRVAMISAGTIGY